MKHFILAVFFSLGAIITQAQVADSLYRIVYEEAQRCANATLHHDYAGLLHYTHPNIVEAAGGKESFLELVSGAMAEMQEAGMRFDTAYAEMPSSKIVEEQGELHCIVPNKLTINMGTSKLVSHSNLFAFSFDQGKTWCFVEAEKLLDSQTRTAFFPKLKTDLVIPDDRIEMIED